MSRRTFIDAAASTAFAFSIVPCKVLGKEKPSNELNLAIIGAGGQGGYRLKNTTSENLVTIADVDQVRSAKAVRNNPRAKAPLYLLVNLALGGGWPIDKTPNPAYMYVDYVRAYSK